MQKAAAVSNSDAAFLNAQAEENHESRSTSIIPVHDRALLQASTDIPDVHNSPRHRCISQRCRRPAATSLGKPVRRGWSLSRATRHFVEGPDGFQETSSRPRCAPQARRRAAQIFSHGISLSSAVQRLKSASGQLPKLRKRNFTSIAHPRNGLRHSSRSEPIHANRFWKRRRI